MDAFWGNSILESEHTGMVKISINKSLFLSVILCGIGFFGSCEDLSAVLAEAQKKDAAMETSAALALYLQADKLSPDNPTVLVGIAKQYGESMVDTTNKDTKIQRGEISLRYAKKALQVAPDFSDAHLAVAVCYGRLMDYEGAKTKVEYSRLVKIHADKAISLDPRSDYAWHLLGRWHRGIAEITPVVRGFAKVVYGGLPDGSNAEAAKAFRKAISLNPDRLAHYIELGIALLADGHLKEGKSFIEKGLSMPVKEKGDPESKAQGKAALADLE